MSSDDFSLPVRAKKHFRVMKEVIGVQRRNIHGLQRTVISLRKRVRTLNGLIDLLNSYVQEVIYMQYFLDQMFDMVWCV
nr:unnamed protein product [Callosobruchus chinensis]